MPLISSDSSTSLRRIPPSSRPFHPVRPSSRPAPAPSQSAAPWLNRRPTACDSSGPHPVPVREGLACAAPALNVTDGDILQEQRAQSEYHRVQRALGAVSPYRRDPASRHAAARPPERHLMSVVAHHTSAGSVASPQLPWRPTWLLSMLLDCALGIGAYLASYWLRFPGDRLETFLPGAWSTMPFVVGGQLVALAVAGAYAQRPGIDWLLRVIVGVVAGTGVSTALLGVTMGFEGVSRIAFGADALLLSIG